MIRAEESLDHAEAAGTFIGPQLLQVPKTIDQGTRDINQLLQPVIAIGKREAAHQEQAMETALKGSISPVAPEQSAIGSESLLNQKPVLAYTSIPNDSRDNAPAQKESVSRGMLASGAGIGALSVLNTYAGSVAVPAATAALAGPVSGRALAAIGGVPLAAGAVGYYLGKKVGHPVAGAVAGTAVGATGILGYASSLAYGSQAAGLAALVPTALTAGIYAAAGAGACALGHWHGNVWKSKPAGLLKTIGRGLISPVSIPVGYVNKALGRL